MSKKKSDKKAGKKKGSVAVVGLGMRTDRPTVISTLSSVAPGHVHIEQRNDGLYHMDVGGEHFEMAINDGLLELVTFEDVEEGEDGGRGQA